MARTVAVVGAGTIGASWAACFLAKGFAVRAFDPAPGADERLRRFVEGAWPAMAILGAPLRPPDEALEVFGELAPTLEGAEHVQESAPEREQLKVALLAAVDELVPPEVLVASSTSGLLASRIQAGCAHPERVLIAHPFNPPHLMPLVELVGGEQTGERALQRAERFYRDLGKHPIRLRREVVGHVANRLQAAMLREVVHLVGTGVASVADVDAAVTFGPGLRWALMGPMLTNHLAGGEGGIDHFFDHLRDAYNTWFDDLGDPRLGPGTQAALVAGTLEEVGGVPVAELARRRDEFLARLLALRGSMEQPAG